MKMNERTMNNDNYERMNNEKRMNLLAMITDQNDKKRILTMNE